MEKDEVKAWLKTIGKDRYWLAEKTNAARLTIDTWLSRSRPIPKRAQALISHLMNEYPFSGETACREEEPPMEESTLVLIVDASTFDLWNEAALLESKLLRQWAADVLTNYAEERVDRAKA